MIAFPAQYDIKTTPEKAATFPGVWPISSGRNVMVKVKDTQTFIQKAREVHGDKYDYSETVYLGMQKPIQIKCRVCGVFELASAKTHLSRMRCGCRKCNYAAKCIRESSGCKFCGKDYSKDLFPEKKYSICLDCHNRKLAGRPCICGTRLGPKNFGICKACVMETANNPPKQAIRKEATKRKRMKACRGCGSQFSSIDRSWCSDECKKKHASKPIRMSCAVCGIEIWKKLRPSEMKLKGRCCSEACQKRWANKRFHQVIQEQTDWVAKSVRAKKSWKKKSSAKRRKEWRRRGGRLWVEVFTVMSKTSYEPKAKDWNYRFNSMVACNRYREHLSVKRLGGTSKPLKSMRSALRSLSKVRFLQERDKWSAKLSSIVSNQRRRMKVKSLRQSLKS